MGVKHSSAPYFLANILQASSLASTMGATTFTGLPSDLYRSNPPSLSGIYNIKGDKITDITKDWLGEITFRNH
jgi:hypothetical protein